MGVGAGLCMYDIILKKFTFAISSADEFLYAVVTMQPYGQIILAILLGRIAIVRTCGLL